MLRVHSLLSSSNRAAVLSQRLLSRKATTASQSRTILQTKFSHTASTLPRNNSTKSPIVLSLRALSSSSNKPPPPKNDAETETQLVLTPGQKVVAGGRLAMWSGILCFATACAFYIGRELIPTKMSANTVFDKAVAILRENGEVSRRVGAPFKAYGRDHGGHREGRRNFIEHSEYVDKEDNSKRTRVRFNLEGQFGQAFVFAEVSSEMPSGEFVYILVQDKENGRVITVVDNRSALMAARMAGGNKEGLEAFSNLLGKGGR